MDANDVKLIDYKDIEELTEAIGIDIYENNYEFVVVAGHYEYIMSLLEELIRKYYATACDLNIRLHDYGYSDEYYLSVLDKCIYVEPAKFNGKYLKSGGDSFYIHQDCNSKILQNMNCENTVIFSVESMDF